MSTVMADFSLLSLWEKISTICNFAIPKVKFAANHTVVFVIAIAITITITITIAIAITIAPTSLINSADTRRVKIPWKVIPLSLPLQIFHVLFKSQNSAVVIINDDSVNI